MDTFNSKKDGFTRNALLTKNQAAGKMKETATSFRETYDDNTKIAARNVQFEDKNVKVGSKNIKLEGGKDRKVGDNSLQPASSRHTNMSGYDFSNGFSEVDVSKTQKEVYGYYNKEHAVTLPPIIDNSDVSRTNERYQKDSRSVHDNLKSPIMDAASGHGTLPTFDPDTKSQVGKRYRNTLSDANANKETIINNKDNRFSQENVYDNLKKTMPYNPDSYNGSHGNTDGFGNITSRDNPGNKIEGKNQVSRKQNGYYSNNVTTVGYEVNNGSGSNEKHTQIQRDNNDRNNNLPSSIYREVNADKQYGNSKDKEEHGASSQRDDTNRNNKSYNASRPTSHESKSISRYVEEDNNRLNENAYNIKHPQLNASDKTNTIKYADAYQQSQNYPSNHKKVYNPTEANKAQTARYNKSTNEKEIAASQIDHNEDNSDRNNYISNKEAKSTLRNEGNGEDAGIKIRKKPKGDEVLNERRNNVTNDRQIDEAHRRRKEYVKRHYNGEIQVFSDDDDTDDDKVADKNAVMSGKDNPSLLHDSQEDNDDDEDDNDDCYSDGEMLDQSSVELKATIEELERRFDSIENEGNEWKTRFETQTEMNQQLEKQILLLQDKVEESKRNLKEAAKSPRDNRLFDDLADASPQMVKSLERERNSLISQVRDLEWRLDQESKAYHKANDERKQYVLEINATKVNVGDLKSKQRQTMLNAPEAPPRITSRSNPGESPRTYRDTGGNIPDGQRILDARYGPIRKTAAVKALPSLD